MTVELSVAQLRDLIKRLPASHELVPKFQAEHDRIIRALAIENYEYGQTHCRYDIPWGGRCKKVSVTRGGMCDEHEKEKCFRCGEQATAGCSYAGQFVCGVSHCDDHSHNH